MSTKTKRETEFIVFLRVDAHGSTDEIIEVAVYTGDAMHRHVYLGTLNKPEKIHFDRTEEWCDPTERSAYRPWRGGKAFGQKTPGRTVLTEAREFAVARINRARLEGALISFALAVAENVRDEADKWSEARVRYLVTMPDEAVRSAHGCFLSAVDSALQPSQVASDAWSRINRLNHTIQKLGPEFMQYTGDETSARLFGRRVS